MKITAITASAAALLPAAFLCLLFMYRSLSGDYDRLEKRFTEQVSEIAEQQKKIGDLNRLDTKHMQELTNAKTEIDRLRIAADRNPERVYIKASCPKTGSVTATGMDDAATARPDDTAVRNYWLLRERIAESEQMILGLQEYIGTQCLK